MNVKAIYRQLARRSARTAMTTSGTDAMASKLTPSIRDCGANESYKHGASCYLSSPLVT
jgi:hypothetical protein